MNIEKTAFVANMLRSIGKKFAKVGIKSKPGSVVSNQGVKIGAKMIGAGSTLDSKGGMAGLARSAKDYAMNNKKQVGMIGAGMIGSGMIGAKLNSSFSQSNSNKIQQETYKQRGPML